MDGSKAKTSRLVQAENKFQLKKLLKFKQLRDAIADFHCYQPLKQAVVSNPFCTFLEKAPTPCRLRCARGASMMGSFNEVAFNTNVTSHRMSSSVYLHSMISTSARLGLH